VLGLARRDLYRPAPAAERHLRQCRRALHEEPGCQLPTIGKILRKLGYYTAYKGKWHLNTAMAVENQPDTSRRCSNR